MEERANLISDTDREWWPFLFLRPEMHAPLATPRVLLLAILYAAPACLAAAVLGSVLGDRVGPSDLWRVVACVAGGFFVLYRLTFAFFWNRRATRVRALEARRSAYLRALRPDRD